MSHDVKLDWERKTGMSESDEGQGASRKRVGGRRMTPVWRPLGRRPWRSCACSPTHRQ